MDIEAGSTMVFGSSPPSDKVCREGIRHTDYCMSATSCCQVKILEKRNLRYEFGFRVAVLLVTVMLLAEMCVPSVLCDAPVLDLDIDAQNDTRHLIYTTELFKLRLRDLAFAQNRDPVVYKANVVGFPDLPKWVFIRPEGNNALLYGSYPDAGLLDIQIVTMNKRTFATKVRELRFRVEKREHEASHEVELKIINYNIEDIMRSNILNQLETVFGQHLWNDSPVVYATKLASVLDVGGRKPLNPRDKEGVIIRIGGTANFSQTLRNLELEVRQLKNRVPCPRDYKRTSVEYHFRQLRLIPDWCGFRLLTIQGDDVSEPIEDLRSRVPKMTNYEGPSMDDLPRRTSFADIIVSLTVPLVLCLVLLSGLTGTTLCLYHSEATVKK